MFWFTLLVIYVTKFYLSIVPTLNVSHGTKWCSSGWSKSTADSLQGQNSTLYTFYVNQVKLGKCRSKGRRYTNKDKSVNILLYYQSPKAYRYLKFFFFFLPNKRTINWFLEVIKFDSGFQTDILSILEKRVAKMKEQEKVCVFLVDEISLKEGLSINELKDRVDGFEDFGVLGRTKQTANQGLVFMVRGLKTNWKQPLTYFFARDSTLHGHLSVLIRPCLQNYLTWVCMLSCVLGIKG